MREPRKVKASGGFAETRERLQALFDCTPVATLSIDFEGNVLSWNPATERDRLEAQFRRAQKMESAGRLAGGVAHDFNNMLSVILGNAELAMGRLKDGDPLLDELQEIQGAAERSAELTRQLLAFARKQTIAPRIIDINNVIGQMLKMST